MSDPVNIPLSIDTLARTLWGEARSCGAAGMKHVASVIINRANHPLWWGGSIVSVCIQPFQFSCRNPGDPNRAKLLAVTKADLEFVVATDIARQAVEGTLVDETFGADSYYALTMKTPPAWAQKASRTFSDGWHAFYKVAPSEAVPVHPDIRNISEVHTPAPQVAEIHPAPRVEDEADILDERFNPEVPA